LTAETKYGGTVTNVKRKRVPGGGSSYCKNTRTEALCGHVGQPTNYSLMNEVYETERIASMQSRPSRTWRWRRRGERHESKRK